MSIPEPRDEHLEHPTWEDAPCAGAAPSGDVVHAPLVPELFRPTGGAPALMASRVQCDEVQGGHQVVHPHEIVIGNEDGKAITHLTIEDVPRFCALLLSLSRS